MVYWSHAVCRWGRQWFIMHMPMKILDLEGERNLFLFEGQEICIDGDIVYKDGVYHLFYKRKGHGNSIKINHSFADFPENRKEQPGLQTANKGSGWKEPVRSNWLTGQVLSWCMMYTWRSLSSSRETTDLKNFSDRSLGEDEFPSSSCYHHSITRAELKRITDKWGKQAELGELPVIRYCPGIHDPEVLVHSKPRYYIYSTTDGQPGWEDGILPYSSADMKDWTYEGVMLDLRISAGSMAKWKCSGHLGYWRKLIDGNANILLLVATEWWFRQENGSGCSRPPSGLSKRYGKPIITDSPDGYVQIDVDVVYRSGFR